MYREAMPLFTVLAFYVLTTAATVSGILVLLAVCPTRTGQLAFTLTCPYSADMGLNSTYAQSLAWPNKKQTKRCSCKSASEEYTDLK